MKFGIIMLTLGFIGCAQSKEDVCAKTETGFSCATKKACTNKCEELYKDEPLAVIGCHLKWCVEEK